jgi:uncharacterized protein (TIGR03086 family)
MDPLDLFDRGSAWTKEKIKGAQGSLDEQTPCEGWNVRSVINHLISGQDYFQKAARGEEATPPAPTPPDVVGDDPVKQYEETRQETLVAFRTPGAKDKAAMTMGIAFVDQVVHGTDIAKATGQDATIPPDLAQAAFAMINGNLTAENRGKAFKPEVEVPENATAQDKLLAYLGRKPCRAGSVPLGGLRNG